jgi:hypothetical protein
MNQGVAHLVAPKCRDDISVGHTSELEALSCEASNVISEGFTRLLPVALQVPGVARTHVHALEVTGEDLPEILLAINDVSQ